MSDAKVSGPALSVPLRQLGIFESVARAQSMRRASEKFYLSQPSMSYAIARLEERLGIKLLDRRASGTYLNDVGVLFQRRVTRMFAQFEQALAELGVPGGGMVLKRIARCITRPQIRSLIAIAENGSMARAAQALAKSQTTVQRRVRELEQTLRAPLLLQTAAGVVASLTAAEFAGRMKLGLREIEWAKEEIDAIQGSSSGEVVIGAMLLSGNLMLATALDLFDRANPAAIIRVVDGNEKDLLRCLGRGDVDFVVGLIAEPTPPGTVAHSFGRSSYVVVARHGHPLTRKQDVTLEDLGGFDWVVGTPGAHRRGIFDEMFADRPRPRARIATCSLPMIRILLAHSDGLALLTQYELQHELEMLTAVQFGSIGHAPSVGVTMREEWLPTQLQQSFLDLMKAHSSNDFAGKPGVMTETRQGLTGHCAI